MIPLLICLSGCAEKKTEFKCDYPPFPKPGSKVDDELEKYCMPQEKCPELWDWIDRLYKLKDQLEIKD